MWKNSVLKDIFQIAQNGVKRLESFFDKGKTETPQFLKHIIVQNTFTSAATRPIHNAFKAKISASLKKLSSRVLQILLSFFGVRKHKFCFFVFSFSRSILDLL